MSIDVKYTDPRIGLPSPATISESNKDSVSPVWIGRMYEITKYNDPDGNKWAVKVLKPDLGGSAYYPSKNLNEIFNEHLEEHKLFTKCFGGLVEPSEFYVEIEPDGKTQYCIVQPWIEDGVQYKEAVMNGRNLSEGQFPELEVRVSFLKGLTKLLKKLDGVKKLPDIDFFVTRRGNSTSIRIFDTTGFWYEKRGGRDRNKMVETLKSFLFTEKELTEPQVSELVKGLYVEVDFSF